MIIVRMLLVVLGAMFIWLWYSLTSLDVHVRAVNLGMGILFLVMSIVLAIDDIARAIRERESDEDS